MEFSDYTEPTFAGEPTTCKRKGITIMLPDPYHTDSVAEIHQATTRERLLQRFGGPSQEPHHLDEPNRWKNGALGEILVFYWLVMNGFELGVDFDWELDSSGYAQDSEFLIHVLRGRRTEVKTNGRPAGWSFHYPMTQRESWSFAIGVRLHAPRDGIIRGGNIMCAVSAKQRDQLLKPVQMKTLNRWAHYDKTPDPSRFMNMLERRRSA